jgi:hypothetical protein
MTIRESLKTKWDALPRGVHFLAGLIALCIVAAFFMFVVPRIWNRWTKPTMGIDKTTQGQIREAEQNKAVADAALGELERAKADLEAEKQKRAALETILNDKSKTTESARKAYQDALNKPAPTPIAGESTDDLCARAKRLGIECPN